MAAKRSSSRTRRAPTKKPTKKPRKQPRKAVAPASPDQRKKGRSKGARPAPKKSAKQRAAPKTRVEGQVEQIQRVIDVMVAAGAVEVELEEAGTRLRVRLKEERPVMTVAAHEPRGLVATALEQGRSAAGVDGSDGAVHVGEGPVGEVFASPMVGTFFRAASPDAEPFVKEGDTVTADTVLCIIEAMKVMNEIKAEMAGQIVEISAQNGEPVEYGQPLFTIKS